MPVGLAGPNDSGPTSGRLERCFGGHRVVAGGWSERGRHRRENQDRFALAEAAGGRLLVAVADGMGGHPSGAEAAWRAVAALVSSALPEAAETALQQSYAAATAAVAELSRRLGGVVTGTTLVAALLDPSAMVVANVGDSRAYRVRAGVAQQLTRDHTWVAAEVASGRLDERAAARDPRRNVLLRAVTGDLVGVDVDSVEGLQPGDALVLCSDGVWAVLDDATLAEVLGESDDVEEAARRLCGAALDAGSTDNVTAVVCRVARPT